MNAGGGPADRTHLFQRDFAVNPFIAIWEVTRACQLHCLHCRAKAQRHRHPLELTTEEGFRLIDQIAEMDRPLLVFTGGDPLEREDLFDFIRYGRERGLEVAMTPSATPRVTREALARAQEAGLARCAFSLDGSTPEVHDHFRGTRGSYELTIRALEMLRDIGMPIQVNTTVSRYNLTDLSRIADVVESFGATLWSVFFLVPTGRARAQDMISAEEAEQVMEWLWEQSRSRTFDIKTTAAPHYRRVVLQHRARGERGRGRDFQAAGPGLRAPRGVNDGNGFVFISHTGDVYPSGFLPIVAGNVRQRPLAELYRDSPVFRELRDPALLKGKCGVCEFKTICGGSRARAWAVTGDALESDPACAYIPSGWQGEARRSHA
ncbi:TIGR04053 family radical SAM/SPASM domain-containing protein [Alicyclobacillus sp.]|uniref:TIGR04053 family radical SAM/SPASM domain-containing protein n=1 Tax=Alicyclobacillus sp. TaxID=61169 RepID=UPI0025BA3BBA|nr:TIGR04053 family radical SAM/SPASM domain-containing protein [Alicyclobacillus sp.]MCL6517032.1 TIGR04053 family radical SAM/SPASM domain-containing protein [Alicyclobacillus sp.]